MANLFDYLIWRSDMPFTLDPFNEVDNLVFSQLAYIDFHGIIGEDFDEALTISEVITGFTSSFTWKTNTKHPLCSRRCVERAEQRQVPTTWTMDALPSSQGVGRQESKSMVAGRYRAG